ncbi:primosomal protein N' [Montanilutibacter psychrotolerans]|uniref:Replication restart protein PriA n=1 Tax=Montanilutibacter psychrotolerans TaxID=1327343 RepID=A0A3M8SZ40_9GAMM|nr:primosomal protein N' [Lysobacter psychrotolerans]RNF84514.1 primosomal protein N' [Lysobacter psychrotolerans]
MPPTSDPTASPGPPAVWRVAVPVPLARLFDYLPAPGEQARDAHVGCRVRVPFGSRELVGVIAQVAPRDPDAPEPKPALALLDGAPLFAGELLESLQWLARYTHAPLGEVFATALPAPLRHGEPLPDSRSWAWRLTEAGQTALAGLRAGKPRALATLLSRNPLDEDALDDASPGWRAAARALGKRALVERYPLHAAPTAHADTPISPFTLGEGQRAAVDAVLAARDGFAALLLDGVTGSGKTEVYLQAIADCLARGKQALVLVPEIGLTPQTLARFRARLGVPVHALHSGLSDGERARTWAAAARGDARVVVGTRSSVFLPLPEAGLLVVDEEHDGSFKQLDGIRYHARDFALVRAKALGVPVLLGSATPSLESLRNAQAGRYAHLRLRERAGVALPPSVRVVDVRKRPLEAGLSPELFEAVSQALAAGGQVLVFKNRRGYAPVLLCHDCGWSAQCQRCDAPMTVHAGGHRLQCHHCGARRPAPNACPDCGGLALQSQGAGTERIEEALLARFPGVPVLRIDRGSTQRRDAMEAMLAKFGREPGILVGTQMLAKGHDLPNLTLVAVVGIDEGLFSADFRAPEKLAQLLVQVAGRAGRAEKAGLVLLQTHHPEHPLLATLLSGGYGAFAQAELVQREDAGFPPFTHMAMFRAEATEVTVANAFLLAARRTLEAAVPAADASTLEINGPLPAPMPRRAGYQRTQLLISAPDRRQLHATLTAALPAVHALPEARKVRWSLDVDPVDLY